MQPIGLIADGYTDCSAPINRALALLPPAGGEILLPAGEILLRQPLRVERGQVMLRGIGREITRLMIASDDGHGLIIGSPHNQVSRVQVCDLSINTRRTLEHGAGVRIYSSYDVHIRNCLLANLNCGIEIADSSFVYVTDCEICDPRAMGGVGILVHGEGVHNDQYFSRVFVQCRKQSAPCEVGLRIANSQGFWVEQCGIFHCGVGLHLTATTGRTLEHGFLSDNAIDTCAHHGLLINAGPGATVRRVQSTGDWCASNEGHGVLLDASQGAVDDIKLLGTRLYGNGGSGLAIAKAASVMADNCSIAGNGRDGVSSGIDVHGACEVLAVRNGNIGCAAGFGNSQAYAIAGIEHTGRSIITGNVFGLNREGTLSTMPRTALVANNLEPVAE
ncbi:right-handed parallel beta-helix repeat-containing protein [Thiomonas sp. FB-6]|uniref:right-handed parallel beta-helix repeat-containing protein n=1 Tax=Thiomonas sp. FB-6 TaxID=1158291 RepID=UPI00037D2F85|nr:right-handed parallel beta-helix repeat-containing protein [Thiomonas sp. FB-6]